MTENPAVRWRKSSHSNSDIEECVEVAQAQQVVAVRDSKDPDGPVLTFAPHAWTALICAIKTPDASLASSTATRLRPTPGRGH
ncbi:DUF397 domain-containing protein [Spirillospora albida]|uniref:DUF397 domain-containing protein n=1 Tax=Spirillospora albida TaxID=58123 RepID=UPI00068AD80B|nr:DUF397 domain-containing protein [Spirillospora albida]